jgi:ABC-type branched-subunit amino acid transport system permease subunit
MTFVKVILAAIVTVVALLVVTCLYIVGLTRGPKGVRGATGIDVAILPNLTIYSPTYWLVVVVVLALLWWFLWRWLFAG